MNRPAILVILSDDRALASIEPRQQRRSLSMGTRLCRILNSATAHDFAHSPDVRALPGFHVVLFMG